jgi:hypothetical protein
MEQLLTLKAIADEQTQIEKYIGEQDRRFDKMVEEIKAGTLDQYGNKPKIVRTFGEPVYVQDVTENDQELESWLYRPAVEFLHSDKIYLYFDPAGNFVRSEYLENKDGKIR